MPFYVLFGCIFNDFCAYCNYRYIVDHRKCISIFFLHKVVWVVQVHSSFFCKNLRVREKMRYFAPFLR